MIFTPNKFGFYQTNNKISFSKLEAMEWNEKINDTVYWNFNDEIFSQYNWKIEPNKPLWELYKERAKQIREQYDYIVLFYSGGSDSHNILHAWLDAKCKIDEIASLWDYDTTGEAYNHHNAEITHVVLPDIKKLKDAGYDYKFRLIDLPKYSLLALNTIKTDAEYFFNHAIQATSIAKQFLHHLKDYEDIVESGKKLCFVWGKEKPLVGYDSNKDKYFCHFCDSIDDVVGVYSQKNYNKGWYDEMFYWTPDLPELPIKMAHVVKNFLIFCEDERLFENNKKANSKIPNAIPYSKKFNKHLKTDIHKQILYPKWSNIIYCNGKTTTVFMGLRDNWLRYSNSEYKNKLSDIIQTYQKKLKQNSSDYSLKIFSSKIYWLE